MPVAGLDHCAVRTADLEGTRLFYEELLGLEVGPRPALAVPGYWLYAGGRPVVHLIGMGAGYERDVFGNPLDTQPAPPTAGVDHLAFRMGGLDALRARLRDRNVAFRELDIPELRLHQVFVKDPNGITAELNFDLDAEEAATISPAS
jgi:catechol 2,3-dioxygenase-like lactoylglutathione lyase family enzyme